MYAVVETGGKQVKVSVGQQIWVEKLDVEEGQEIVLDKVLMVGGDKLAIGKPYLDSARVVCEVEKQGRGKKIRIFKYVAKSGSTHRRQGHRQPYTRLLVKAIEQ